MRRLIVPIALLVTSSAAQAHDTGIAHDERLPWTLDPAILLPLLMAIILFEVGGRCLRTRAVNGGDHLGFRQHAFRAGWAILAIALVSPLHVAGERSFGAHMFEHELIMLAAAPLLAASRPLVIMLWALPARWRPAIGSLGHVGPVRALWMVMTGAVAATVLQAAMLWLWHAPALFDLALADEGWHVVQHLSFLASALLFWTAMFGRRTPAGVAALCLVVTSIVSGALGALMAFATSPWYTGYARLGTAPFGLTPAEDQQLAGLLMWVPGGVVHAAAALFIVRRILKPAHA